MQKYFPFKRNHNRRKYLINPQKYFLQFFINFTSVYQSTYIEPIVHSNILIHSKTFVDMSKTKELFIIGATAASCAIGYAFYKNNENNQDQQKEKMKQSLIQSTSSAMDMREPGSDSGRFPARNSVMDTKEHGSDSLHGPARNSVMDKREHGSDSLHGPARNSVMGNTEPGDDRTDSLHHKLKN